MISRKDYILNRPWQDRKYDHHRRKVQSATPAIDNKPPKSRQHVALKLKKQQTEKERIKKIEHENFLLLQRLNFVTRTNTVDNFWKTPQPGFLNRVALFDSPYAKYEDDDSDSFETVPKRAQSGRKFKCTSCTPKKPKVLQTPEPRIPWEPERKPMRKHRSQSVPPKKPLPVIKEEAVRPKTTENNDKNIITIRREFLDSYTNNLVITRGCLKLCVKFPPDTTVKFRKGCNERFIAGGKCCCSMPKNKQL